MVHPEGTLSRGEVRRFPFELAGDQNDEVLINLPSGAYDIAVFFGQFTYSGSPPIIKLFAIITEDKEDALYFGKYSDSTISSSATLTMPVNTHSFHVAPIPDGPDFHPVIIPEGLRLQYTSAPTIPTGDYPRFVGDIIVKRR